MARMFPSSFPSKPAATASDASGQNFERAVYGWLQRKLPDTALVFHSFRIPRRESDSLSFISDGSERDVLAEIDFVIANPGWPLIVIEAKAGRLHNTHGRLSHMHGPNHSPIFVADQVQRAINHLSRFLGENIAGLPRHILAFCCVDAWNNPDLAGVSDLPILYFDKFTQHLSPLDQPLIVNAAKSSGHMLLSVLSHDHIQETARLFTIHIDRQYRLTAQRIRSDAEALGENTQHQIEDLLTTEVHNHSRLLITGYAGSGKTWLLKSTAKDIAKTASNHVLILCYNELLALDLRQSIGNQNVQVFNFHGLCEYLLTQQRLPAEVPKQLIRAVHKDSQYYDGLNTAASIALDLNPELLPRFDAVVIDEAQDFDLDWFTLVGRLTKPQARWFVAMDPTQKWRTGDQVLSLDSTLLTEFHHVHMEHNLRNTSAIADHASAHFNEEATEDNVIHLKHPTPNWPQGVAVTTVAVANRKQLWSELKQQIDRLITLNALSPADITILSADSHKTLKTFDGSSLLTYGDQVGEYLLIPAEQGGSGIRLDTIRRFKGLESPVVIVVEYPDTSGALRYLAYTRAQAELIVIRVEGVKSSRSAA